MSYAELLKPKEHSLLKKTTNNSFYSKRSLTMEKEILNKCIESLKKNNSIKVQNLKKFKINSRNNDNPNVKKIRTVTFIKRNNRTLSPLKNDKFQTTYNSNFSIKQFKKTINKIEEKKNFYVLFIFNYLIRIKLIF